MSLQVLSTEATGQYFFFFLLSQTWTLAPQLFRMDFGHGSATVMETSAHLEESLTPNMADLRPDLAQCYNSFKLMMEMEMSTVWVDWPKGA